MGLLRLDFKGRSIIVTSYSIRSRGDKAPQSWVVEVSNDGDERSWEVADCRENNSDLNDNHAHNFAISPRLRESFRFVRLRQTGKNHKGNDDLCLSALEIFGTENVRGATPR